MQVTDLGVHAKIGRADGVVWVTGVSDGMPRAGATVGAARRRGRPLATRDDGRARTRTLRRLANAAERARRRATRQRPDFEGYVSATLGDDRAITAISEYDPDLEPWRFNVSGACGDERLPLAGAVFTERGIYRPGEKVYAKAIVRDGSLGELRAPARGDSIRWIFHDREDGVLRKRTTSALGVRNRGRESRRFPRRRRSANIDSRCRSTRRARGCTVASANYRVAEYRPPEFLVDMTRVDRRRSFRATRSRDSAGALSVRRADGPRRGRRGRRATPVVPWELEIPGIDGWYIGDDGAWWEESSERTGSTYSPAARTRSTRAASARSA